jgi:HEAT repeat protein
MTPNKTPEPTAVIAVSSAIAVNVPSRLWLSFGSLGGYTLMKFTLFLIFMGLLLCGCSKKHAPPEVIVDGTPLTSWLTNYYNRKPELFDEALAKVGTNAVPTLLWMLQQTNRAQNQAAYFAFNKLGARAQGAVPSLIQIYESRITPFSRQCAASSIASVGPAGNSAIPVLIRGSSDKNILVRCDTLQALGRLNSQSDLVVPTLTNALNDPVPRVRISACIALGEVGERSKEVVPALVMVSTNDSDQSVRLFATNTLNQITLEKRAQDMLRMMHSDKSKPPNTALEPTPTAP